jgi:NADH-quinone oxidoreductase subunit L
MNGDLNLLAWLIVLLPVLGFLILALAGSRIEAAVGRRALGAISVIPIAICFVLAVLLTLQLAGQSVDHRMFVVPGPPWIDIMGLRVPFELIVDPLSLTMALIITGVGSLIFLYSTGYMADERDYSRFFTYMNLFVASMLLLVMGNNLPLLFIGWEGVGLCSYLLIGFWYQDLANARAANKAFIVNRIGDWGLTLGIFTLLILVVSVKGGVAGDRFLSYDAMLPVLYRALQMHPDLATAAALLLFVGAAGKSAQFPLYLWLPDAMAGPTPVSALIHAATMVTSGVVLLNRLHIVFEASPIASAVVCGIGAFTALYAAIIAFGQTDIKRVLAYSTVSQLGFMFIGCGAGAYWAGMFHVTTHAFFKALLFLGAGAVIYSMSHTQDMRNYGRLAKYLPITYFSMLAGWVAICAIPPFAGFFSKDALIGAALANDYADINGVNVSMISGWIGLVTAVLTAIYMTRLIWLTFLGNQERWRNQPEHADAVEAEEHSASDDHHEHGLKPSHTPKEVPPSMAIPLVVLAVLSLASGFLLWNGGMFEKWLAPSSSSLDFEIAAEPSGIPLTAISTVAAILGVLIGIYMYRRGLPASEGFDESKWSPTRLWVRRQFGFDDAMTEAGVDGGREAAMALWTGFEFGILDRIVNGLGALSFGLGKGLSVIQRGLVRSYALLMLIGGVCVVGYFLFAGGGR